MRINRPCIYLLLIAAILIVGFFSVDDCWAKKKIICEYCGEEIHGQYVLIDGKYYHPIHFKCANCNTPIGHTTYIKKDGKYYCEKCYEKLFAPRCAYCGEVITGKQVITGGETYHDSCYYKYVAKYCSICGEVIIGEYYADYWGNHYHKAHLDTMHRCEYCGRVICDKLTSGGTVYSDDRHVCNICRGTAVDNIDEAMRLQDSALSLLTLEGIEIDKGKIKLHLVDRDELKKISDEDIDLQEGFTLYRWSKREQIVINRSFDIYILEGMPRIHFISVMAHELMHVWQHYNAIENNDRQFCEGSCNYASFLVLKYLPGDYTNYLIHKLNINEDPVYGDGFRRVKEFVARNGIDYWLYQLENDKKLPSGF